MICELGEEKASGSHQGGTSGVHQVYVDSGLVSVVSLVLLSKCLRATKANHHHMVTADPIVV